jgi:hypothetical protein
MHAIRCGLEQQQCASQSAPIRNSLVFLMYVMRHTQVHLLKSWPLSCSTSSHSSPGFLPISMSQSPLLRVWHLRSIRHVITFTQFHRMSSDPSDTSSPLLSTVISTPHFTDIGSCQLLCGEMESILRDDSTMAFVSNTTHWLVLFTRGAVHFLALYDGSTLVRFLAIGIRRKASDSSQLQIYRPSID